MLPVIVPVLTSVTSVPVSAMSPVMVPLLARLRLLPPLAEASRRGG
jgi:p-aminobenzoyl-glutamate transporter AbgT